MRAGLRAVIFGWAALVAVTCEAANPNSSGDRVRYKWRDESGALHYEDAIPPEAVKFGYEVVNKQGVTVKRVDKAKTPEELAAAKAAAARAAEDKRKIDEAQRADAQLLAAYPTEDDLRKALQAQIDLINQNIQATEIGIASQEKSLGERLNHAAEQERIGKPVPPAVQKQINTLKDGLATQRAFLQRRTQDRENAQKNLESSLEHYREIKGVQAESR